MKENKGEVVDAELGRLITVRRRVAFNVFVLVLSVPLAMLLIGGGVGMLVSPNARRTSDWQVGLAFLLIGLLFGVCVWQAFRGMRTKLWFFELGAVRSVGKRRACVIPYVEASGFTLRLVHQSVHGIYAGTAATIKLRAPGKRKIDFSGNYKVKARGLFKRTYEVKDDFERVREAISEQMADSLLDRMIAGEEVRWVNSATMTATAFTPRFGKLKGQALAHGTIDRFDFRQGMLHLFQAGEKRSFIALPAGQSNFWPCFTVFLRLAKLHYQGEAMDDSTPGEDSGDDE